MNINSHFLFAAAAAAFLVGKPEAIVLAGVGSVIPDLDRPYWFIPKKRLAEEEFHRAFLHNIVALAFTYLLNPYLGLGLFSHLLLDSMTTVKDRGVEWLFPFTRIIPRDYWSQAEVQREPLVWIPWRRTYGPALNGHMLDTYVSLCSGGILILWSVLQNLQSSVLDLSYWVNSGFLLLAGTVLLFYASGEYVQAWPNWSGTKRFAAIALLALIMSAIVLMIIMFTQGPVFAWKPIASDSLLKSNDLLNKIFLTSTIAYAVIILKYIRSINMAIADSISALCTKMPSRDFIIEEWTKPPDVFV